MSHHLKAVARALVLVAATLVSTAAQAQTVPHRERCTGVITAFAIGSLEYAGEGFATSFGKYTIVGGHQFDLNGNISNGVFITTAADGSTIWGVYTGQATILQNGEGRSDLHVFWIGGTGRFKGVTGEGDVICFHGLTTGAELEYVTEGTLTRE